MVKKWRYSNLPKYNKKYFFDNIGPVYLVHLSQKLERRSWSQLKNLSTNDAGSLPGLNLDRAHVPEALSFTVGHAVFADGVPGWHSHHIRLTDFH